MTRTLIIDGGLGRVITAIPALEKYVDKYPDTIILIHMWIPILFGNKKLINNVYDPMSKGILNKIKYTKIYKPEPYYNSSYLQGKINLIDAWNQEINGDTESLNLPKIYLTSSELASMKFIRDNYYNKIIAFQPFGSSAIIQENNVIDNNYRSLNIKTTQHLVKVLRDEGYGIWLMGDKPIPFLSNDNFIGVGSQNIREVVALLAHCDYFLGIDSSGQHIARIFNIPGSIIMGGTNTINVTYPDHFNILNDQSDKTYMPYRIAEFDSYLAELDNSDIMELSDKDLHIMGKNILRHINKSTKNKVLNS